MKRLLFREMFTRDWKEIFVQSGHFFNKNLHLVNPTYEDIYYVVTKVLVFNLSRDIGMEKDHRFNKM